MDRLDYQVGNCEHFTHSSDNGSILAALSDCHDGKFVSGFLATNELRFDISNTNTEEDSIFNEKVRRHVQVDLVSSLPETKSSLIDPSLFNEMDDASPKRSATVLYCGAHIVLWRVELLSVELTHLLQKKVEYKRVESSILLNHL